MSMVTGALTGLLAGACYGGVGYFSNNEDFELKKFAPDVIITALAGAAVGSQGEIPSESAIQATVASLGALGINKFVRKIFQSAKLKLGK